MRLTSAFVLAPAFALACVTSGCTKSSPAGDNGTTAQTTVLTGAVAAGAPSSGESKASDPDVLACQEAADGLPASELLGENPDPDHVTGDLTLPDSRGGVSVTWTSGFGAVTISGHVVRPSAQSGDATGSLEAAFTQGAARVVRAYPFTVLPEDLTDSEAVAADKAALLPAAMLGTNASPTRITTDLSLPSTGAHGSTIAWATTNAAIAANGHVVRPPYKLTSASGTLTATITRNTATAVSAPLATTVLRAQPPLLITEVFGGTHTDEGWIEVLNTTDAALNLADFGWRSCNAGPCSSVSSGTIPATQVQAGAYVLLHAAFAHPSANGVTDVTLTGLQLYYGFHFFELTKAGQTVDFVRWSSGSPVPTGPLTGSFAGTASMASGTGGMSLARPFPHDDTDAAADWTFVENATPGGPNGIGTDPGTDSDGDGLSDDYEINVSHTDPLNPDTDGDGFSDGQEVLESGLAGINLKALGADPLVRDIFMELDYMAAPAGVTNNLFDSTANAYSLKPRRAALDRVKAMFAAYAPPPGQFPIRIHLDVGHLFNPGGTLSPDDYDLGGGNEIPFERCLYLGHDGTHTSSNCADLYEIKQQYFETARRYIFHYFIIGWSQLTNGAAGSSGLAEVSGNDGIITIGSWGYDASLEQAVVNFQAATLVHELGHNLGLQHGGDDSQNYKPNYVSAMNYTYQLSGLDANDDGDVFYNQFPGHPLNHGLDVNQNSPSFVMNFSHGGRGVLNEATLDETAGWRGVPIDFDADGLKTHVGAQANVQPTSYNTANTDVLHDFDDWSSLDLKFQAQLSAELNGVSPYALTDPSEDKQPLSTPCLERPPL